MVRSPTSRRSISASSRRAAAWLATGGTHLRLAREDAREALALAPGLEPARLLVALGRAGKEYELLALPEERHMPRDKAGLLDLETRICGFLERHLA